MIARPEKTDSQIREKINSLDSLPDGYAPSLDSKWELLMAAREPERTRKKGLYYVYSAAAACLLLVLLFGFLLVREGNRPVPVAAAEKENPLAGLAQKPEEASPQKMGVQPGIHHTLAPVAQEVKIINSRKPDALGGNNKTTKILSAKANPGAGHDVEELQTLPIGNQTDITLSSLPETRLAQHNPETTNKARKRKKARSIEITFEDGPVPNPANHDPQVAQQGLEFRFFNKPAGGNVAKHDSPLKVQHTF